MPSAHMSDLTVVPEPFHTSGAMWSE